MKTLAQASLMTLIGICIAVSAALAVNWTGEDDVEDQMKMLGYDDLIHMGDGDDDIDMGNGNDTFATRQGDDTIMTGWGEDEINLGPAEATAGSDPDAVDKINFFDGTAQLIFHDATMAPTNAAYIEYVEDGETLTVYAPADFVININ